MFRDIAHPLNSEMRRKIEEQSIVHDREVLADSGEALSAEIRLLGSRPQADASGYDPLEAGGAPWP